MFVEINDVQYETPRKAIVNTNSIHLIEQEFHYKQMDIVFVIHLSNGLYVYADEKCVEKILKESQKDD